MHQCCLVSLAKIGIYVINLGQRKRPICGGLQIWLTSVSVINIGVPWRVRKKSTAVHPMVYHHFTICTQRKKCHFWRVNDPFFGPWGYGPTAQIRSQRLYLQLYLHQSLRLNGSVRCKCRCTMICEYYIYNICMCSLIYYTCVCSHEIMCIYNHRLYHFIHLS
jgi:hypothetical protein